MLLSSNFTHVNRPLSRVVIVLVSDVDAVLDNEEVTVLDTDVVTELLREVVSEVDADVVADDECVVVAVVVNVVFSHSNVSSSISAVKILPKASSRSMHATGSSSSATDTKIA